MVEGPLRFLARGKELGDPALGALGSARPFLFCWNAAGGGLGGDGCEREAENEAWKPLYKYLPICTPSFPAPLWVQDFIIRSRLV